jgi:hypothetical protein
MARIVLGAGTSHTPLLTLDGARWDERAADDLRNQRLVLSDGRTLSYQMLKQERGEPYAERAQRDHFIELHRVAQLALDRLADALEAAAPDVIIVIGDDQNELFGHDNMPAVAVYYGADVVMHPWPDLQNEPSWRIPVTTGYAMDAAHVFPGHPQLGEHIIRQFIAHDIDIGAARSVPDPVRNGFGHAYGFVVKRLLRGRRIPMVPILLNTYFPPNTPRPSRCYDIGVALRAAIADCPLDLKVCIIASGGLSHFVTDEALDRRLLEGLRRGDRASLDSIPEHALLSGSSEIRNWILLGGAIAGMKNNWCEYHPVYRTPAGTGLGLAFATWQP